MDNKAIGGLLRRGKDFMSFYSIRTAYLSLLELRPTLGRETFGKPTYQERLRGVCATTVFVPVRSTFINLCFSFQETHCFDPGTDDLMRREQWGIPRYQEGDIYAL